MFRLFTDYWGSVLQRFFQTTVAWGCLSGVLLGAAFLHQTLFWLAVPGLWYLISGAVASRHWLAVFLGVWLAECFHYGAALCWFFAAYPLDTSAALSSGVQLTIITVMWLTATLALGFGAALVLTPALRLVNRQPATVLLVPFVFILSELAGSFIFSLVALGPGSSINTAFSFGYLGYLVADSHLWLQLARFGGVYMLTAGVVGVVAILWVVGEKIHQSTPTLGITTALFVLSVIGGNALLPSPTPQLDDASVVTIHTAETHSLGASNEERATAASAIRKRVTAALKEHPALVILPEGAEFTSAFDNPRQALQYLTLNTPAPVTLVDAFGLSLPGEPAVARAFVYNTGLQRVDVIDKQYLTPIGEYPTYQLSWVVRFLSRGSVEPAAYVPTYQPGPAVYGQTTDPAVPTIVFCFEIIDPMLMKRRLAIHPAPYVVHPTSFAWFHNASTLHLALARMKNVAATWSQVPIVEATNRP